MKTIAKLAFAGVLAAGAAVATAAPAEAAHVSVGIGVGTPVYYGHRHSWCYYHPYRCDRYRPAYIRFYSGGHHYHHGWHDRDRWHDRGDHDRWHHDR